MAETSEELGFSPWWLVLVAAAALGAAGTYQFAWSAIRLPLENRLETSSEAAIGTVYTLFVICQTTVQFPAGWVRDRWGPRIPLAVSAMLLTVGYIGTALAGSIWHVYLYYSIGGIGVGILYTVAVNTPVKWFNDHRGLATGVALFSYSGVSFFLIPAVRNYIITDFVTTLFSLGVLAGVMAIVAVPVLRDPSGVSALGKEPRSNDGSDADLDDVADASDSGPDTHDPAADEPGSIATETAYSWRDTIRTWQFWLLYAVFVAINGVSLMLVGKVIAFADSAGVSAGAATAAASLVALGDAVGGVVTGGASDWFGRERTVGVSLLLSGASLTGLIYAANAELAVVFIVLAGAASFFRSAPFYVFPSLVGEYYGDRHSSTNYALLYTSKLWGGVAGGAVASGLVLSIGWTATFLVGGVLAVLAGVAMFFVRPV